VRDVHFLLQSVVDIAAEASQGFWFFCRSCAIGFFALESLQWAIAVLMVPEQHLPMLARVM